VHLVTTLLGLEADAPGQRLSLDPCLPAWLGEVALRNLRVGEASVDLHVGRDAEGVQHVDHEVTRGALEVVLWHGALSQGQEPLT